MLAVLVIVSLLNVNIAASADTGINPNYCLAYISIDAATGDVLYSYNADRRIYPASTTKLMTALVAVENSTLNKVFTTSKNATRFLEDGSGELDLKTGETMDLYSLLHGLLIRSYNDVALVIAENVAGTEEAFIDMMNTRALELGCVNTHFVTPHGLHNVEHYTTARDLAVIAQAAFSDFTIATICSKRIYSLPATNMRNGFDVLENTNVILGSNTGYSFTVTEGKTGYTFKAQNVLVSMAKDTDGREIITVMAGVTDRDFAGELTLQLLDASFSDYGILSIAKAGEIIDTYEGVSVANASYLEHLVPYDTAAWTLDKTFTYRNDIIYTECDIGDILGTVSYSYNGNYIGESLLVAASSLKAASEYTGITKITRETLPIDTDKSLSDIFPVVFYISLGITILLLTLIILFVIPRKNKNDKAAKNRKRVEELKKSRKKNIVDTIELDDDIRTKIKGEDDE